MNAPDSFQLPPDAVAVAMLPVSAIVASPSNPRKHFDEAYIAELAESIKAHGLIQPITVRPNPIATGGLWPYQLVVGECRWRAAKLAGLEEVPGFWREIDDRQALEIQVVENLQRRDVHPIEEAEGYQQLMALAGYSADDIAAKIGKSRGYVYARLKLTALCAAARDDFFAGKLEASTALLIARIPGEALQKKALKKIINGYNGEPLSYRTAVYEIRNNFTTNLKQATFPLDDAALVLAAGSCTACPKRSGNALDVCADLADEDVCTDTQCFDDKRLARRAHLIAHAEKRKIPVVTDDKAWQIYRDDAHVDIDSTVESDGQERTYREILGDALPKPAALIEIGYGGQKRLIEMADATAMEKALKKAGWTPDLFTETPAKAATAEDRKKRKEEEARQAERKAREEAGSAEGKYRKKLADATIGRLRKLDYDSIFDPGPLISLLAAAWLRFDFTFNGSVDADRLERFGIAVPDEYEGREELENVAAIMADWPPSTALAFLFDAMTSEEINTSMYTFDPEVDRPYTLLALANCINFDPESLRAPASPPTHAAQAGDKAATPAAPAEPKVKKPAAKKAKAKTDPAPAAPANEAAAPPENVHDRVMSHTDWPFPAPAENRRAA